MSTTTPNFGFIKPAVNDISDADLWGGYLNDDWDLLDTELATRSKDYAFADYKITAPALQDVAEIAYNLGNISGAVTVDYTNGNYQYATVTGDITSLTITNPPASGRVGFLTLELNQDGTGGRTITLNGSVYLTPNDAPVVLTTTASAKDKLRLETRNAGTTWDVFTNLNIK